MQISLVSISPSTTYRFHRKYLGLGYLHAYALADQSLAERIDITHDCFDTTEAPSDLIAARILHREFDLVGFTCFVWNTPLILTIIVHLKKLKPGLKIILGGPEVEARPTELMNENPAIDFICTGPGEKTFKDLLHVLLDGGSAKEVNGLAIRTGESIHTTPPQHEQPALAEIPSPYLTGVIEIDETDRGGLFQTSRGCPNRCGFCAWSRQHTYAEFPLDQVFAEIRYFKEKKADSLYTIDANFNMNTKRVVRILNAMEEIGMQAGLWFEANPRLLNEEFMEALSRLPATYMGLGIQTTNPEAMKHIDRMWDPEKTAKLLDSLAQYENCHQGYEVIMGLPGDNLTTFKKTLSWVYARNPDWVHLFPLGILPGTPLSRNKDKLQIRDEGPGSYHEIVSNYSFSAEEVQVGKAMRMWHRVLMQVFFRLTRATNLDVGELLEQWSWHAYGEGLHPGLQSFNVHRADWDYVERVAQVFRAFCSHVMKAAGLPDLSLQFSELLRYIQARRHATEEWGNFFRALDIHGISLDTSFNRIVGNQAIDEETLSPDAARRCFEFDMKVLWPLIDMEKVAAVTQEKHTYIFDTDEEGLAMVYEVDDA